MAAKSDLRARRTAAHMHALASVRREIRLRDSASGRKYLREFMQAFRQYDSILSCEQLEQKLAEADILLVGDYHALAASQRFAAELLERRAQNRPVVLGVEAVLSRDQRILDAWWRREISEEHFRRRLRFDGDWGYDWPPFYNLLSSARDHAEGIYGLDCMPRTDLRKIRSRDRHAAAKICQMREQHREAAIIVLFGESHMAPQHLPRLVSKALPQQRVLTVLQNVDTLYWHALEQQATAVGVNENTVCVFNSSPLEKYESYRLCLERWNAPADDLPDFAPAVYNVISSLAKALGFRMDSPHNGTQPKFLSDSLPEVLNAADILSTDQELTKRLDENGCAYIADTNTFVVREFQMAQVAGEAARFLHHACRGACSTGDIQQRTLEIALADFGSRLLCPSTQSENHLSTSAAGEALYGAYLNGRITRTILRKLFLSQSDFPRELARTDCIFMQSKI
jgi:hypothetical protein